MEFYHTANRGCMNNASCVIPIITRRHITHRNLIKLYLYDTCIGNNIYCILSG